MSLLKRIEKSGATPATPSSPSSSGGSAPPDELRRRQAPAPPRDAYVDLKSRLQQKIVAELDPKLDLSKTDNVRRTIEELFNALLAQEDIVVARAERLRLFEEILSEILGYGPIQKLLNDDTISEIMVNGPRNVYVEKRGKIERVGVVFDSDQHVMRIIDRIVSPLGRRVDEGSPYVDARLPDGSRVNVIIPPLALMGPTITIRKFSRIPFTLDDLVKNGTFTTEYVEFVKASVFGKLNIIISGGTGTGKTTQLNILSSFIPESERIITIENAAELQLRQEHVITLESRPPNIEGRGEVSMRDLVVNALRMRPDRIIVGEVRAGEALDMLQAMNTGHEGSMSTVHANTPRDALHRLETMVLMAGIELPLKAIREQIASAIDVIIQIERMRDGQRRVVAVTEVQGMEGDVLVTQEVFKFEHAGQQDGKILGRLKPTGVRPKFMEKLEAANIFLPPNIFGLDKRFFS
ncbi:MAG: CpaF family protein [Chloroflexi bacterium]|nr:CpaF family protein [Chloroflexota bacterium]MBI3742354.1 CpaF family protein [Chloroflexota bacterium]